MMHVANMTEADNARRVRAVVCRLLVLVNLWIGCLGAHAAGLTASLAAWLITADEPLHAHSLPQTGMNLPGLADGEDACTLQTPLAHSSQQQAGSARPRKAAGIARRIFALPAMRSTGRLAEYLARNLAAGLIRPSFRYKQL